MIFHEAVRRSLATFKKSRNAPFSERLVCLKTLDNSIKNLIEYNKREVLPLCEQYTK